MSSTVNNNNMKNPSSSTKRPVAKHACLACREKKIKCDGEVLTLEQQAQMHQLGQSNEILYTVTESGEIRHKQCTNCKNLNLRCVFVKSQRGGRKKKDTGNSSSHKHTGNIHGYSSSISGLDSLKITNSYTKGNSNDKKPTLQVLESTNSSSSSSSNNSNNFQQQQPSLYGLQSSSVPLSQSSSYQFQQQTTFQYPITQPMYNTVSMTLPLPPTTTTTTSAATYAPIKSNSNSYESMIQQPSPVQPPYNQRTPPSTTITSSGFTPPTKLIFSNPASKPFEFANLSNPTPPQLPPQTIQIDYITVSDSLLYRFDLPSWSITTKLIDSYYRYIHPSRPFLPPKHRLIYELNIKNDASLLHAMFVSSCRFVNDVEIPSFAIQWKDPEHWYFLAEKYWDYLDLEKSLQALVLLMGSLGPNGYVQQSIEGCERIYKIFKLYNLLNFLQSVNFDEFKKISTKRQIINYEDLLRTVWGSWKLNVFLRINRGVPFKKITEEGKILEFPKNLPLPLSDLDFNQNSKIYDEPVHDSKYLEGLNYQKVGDIKKQFLANSSTTTTTLINDETCIILAVRIMEKIMDEISSTGPLSLESIENYNNRLSNLLKSSTYQLWEYHVTRKPTYVINISKVFAVCITTVAKLSINVSQCSSILLVKPHITNMNKHPDYVFNSLNESKIYEIEEACLALTPHIFEYYIKTFISSLEIIKIIELGYGITNSFSSGEYILNPSILVIGGPTNFQPSCKISSITTQEEWWASPYSDTYVLEKNACPDVWLQYPVFSVVCVGHSLTVLASSIMLTKLLKIIQESIVYENGMVMFEMLLTDCSKLPLRLSIQDFETFRGNFNTEKLNSLIKLCAKFIHSHGKYWAYIESVSDQADGIVNYIDDLVNRN